MTIVDCLTLAVGQLSANCYLATMCRAIFHRLIPLLENVYIHDNSGVCNPSYMHPDALSKVEKCHCGISVFLAIVKLIEQLAAIIIGITFTTALNDGVQIHGVNSIQLR